jgi:hypothetical protein
VFAGVGETVDVDFGSLEGTIEVNVLGFLVEVEVGRTDDRVDTNEGVCEGGDEYGTYGGRV